MPARDGQLLLRLAALVGLVVERRGLVLGPSEEPTAAELRSIATAAGIQGPGAGRSVRLLCLLAEGVGLVRRRGGRLEATALVPCWERLAPGLRAGLVYAAWCHRVPWTGTVPGMAVTQAVHSRRLVVVRALLRLPPMVDVAVDGLVAMLAESAGLPAAAGLDAVVTAAFLDPLSALGVADLAPPPPASTRTFRLHPEAHAVIGSALVAAGEPVPLAVTAVN